MRSETETNKILIGSIGFMWRVVLILMAAWMISGAASCIGG